MAGVCEVGGSLEGTQRLPDSWSSCKDVEAAWFPASDDLVEVGPGRGGEGCCLGGEVGDLGEADVIVDEGCGAGADLVEEFADAGFCVAGVSACFDDLEAPGAGVVEVAACGVVDEFVCVDACEVDVASVDAVHGVEEVVGGDVGCGDGGEFVEEEVGGESFFHGSMRFKPGEGFTDLEGGSAAVSAVLDSTGGERL